MISEDLRFLSSGGDYDISGRMWAPEGEVTGVVQIAHGMSEHIGRYEEFAVWLTERGYAVCANDHRGHGGSYGGSYGFMGDRDGYIYMAEDMRLLMELVKPRYAEKPYVLLGHSMGSFLARYFCAKYGDMLDGAIYSGTGDGLPAIKLLIPLCRLMSAVKGRRAPGKLFGRITGKSYNKRIVSRRGSADWLTSDEKLADAFVADEKCGFPFTYGGYLDLLMLIRSIGGGWCGRVPKALPIYMFSGDEDPVGDYGKGVTAVYRQLKEAGVQDVTLKLYPGGRHEMLNETNRADVYNDVAGWLDERFK